MKTLVCKTEPFDLYQKVYEISDNGNAEVGKKQLDELQDFIPTYCYNNNIQQVTFIGDYNLSNNVIQQIRKKEKTEYSNKKPLIMEVR